MQRLRRLRTLGCSIVAGAASVLGLMESARAEEPDDSFVADDGARHSFTESYLEGYRPSRREPHYLRASVEMASLLGIGAALYYTKEANEKDWDYPDVGTRFRHLKVTFDTNPFTTNTLHHPVGGAAYYLFARTNGLGVPAAAAYTIASEVVWELAFEVREKASINDLVFTPVGGISAGEVFVHLGDYFNSTPGAPRWYHEVLGWLFGPTHRLHRALDGNGRFSTSLPADRLGYSSFYTHRFDVLAGPIWVDDDRHASHMAAQLRLAAEIVSIPGFLRPGRFGVNFSDGDFVEALAQFDFGDHASAVDLLFDANLFGRYAQDIKEDYRSGVAGMIAFDTALRYANRTLLDRPDNYAMAHVGGPSFKLWSVNGELVARFDGAAHFDLAAIRSLAFSEYASRFGLEDVASVLKAERYYYGLGGSGTVRGTLSYRALEIGARAFFGKYASLDDHDRFPDQVPHAIHTTDTIAELECWAALSPRLWPVQIRGFFEYLPRKSTMASITTDRWDERYGITVGVSL